MKNNTTSVTPTQAAEDLGTCGSTATVEAATQRGQAQFIEGDGTKMQLYVRSMGKLLAVTAIFDNDDKCNSYLENHRDEGVVACGAGLVLAANLYDHGTKAELPLTSDRTKLYLSPDKKDTSV